MLGADSGLSDFRESAACGKPGHPQSKSVAYLRQAVCPIWRRKRHQRECGHQEVDRKDVSDYDIHIQFVDMVSMETANITIATAIISAFEDIPIDQNLAMTGSLSVRGGSAHRWSDSKIEAAAKSGNSRATLAQT